MAALSFPHFPGPHFQSHIFRLSVFSSPAISPGYPLLQSVNCNAYFTPPTRTSQDCLVLSVSAM